MTEDRKNEEKIQLGTSPQSISVTETISNAIADKKQCCVQVFIVAWAQVHDYHCIRDK